MAIYKTSQMNVENSPGDTDLAKKRMSEGLFPCREGTHWAVGACKAKVLDQGVIADAEVSFIKLRGNVIL